MYPTAKVVKEIDINRKISREAKSVNKSWFLFTYPFGGAMTMTLWLLDSSPVSLVGLIVCSMIL